MIAPREQPFYRYVLVQCADPRRHERLNIGVVVTDPEGQEVGHRFVSRLTRASKAFPQLPLPHLRTALKDAGAMFEEVIGADGIRALEDAATQWRNILQVSEVRSLRASSIEHALEDAFAKYVATPGSAPPADRAKRPSRSNFTSGRQVRRVRNRLMSRGLSWEEFETDAEVDGRSESGVRVPVWYPIVVRGSRAFDGFDIKKDYRQAWDAARLLSQKAQETLRAHPDFYVALTIRSRNGAGDLPRELADLIKSEGRTRVADNAPEVYVIRDLDQLDDVVTDMGVRDPEDPQPDAFTPPD